MKKTVLIIDDEIDFCLLMKKYLTKREYTVNVSYSLMDGLASLDTNPADVIFLDNNLPDGLGWEVAPRLAKKYPSTIINLISAFHPAIPQFDIYDNLHVIEKPLSTQDIESYLS